MARRALVAYRNHGDSITLRYAHDADGLAERISRATPLGGPADAETSAPRDALADRLGIETRSRDVLGPLDEREGSRYSPATRVDPRPLAVAIPTESVVRYLDPCFDGLVVVGPGYDVRTALVCSLAVARPTVPDRTDLALVVPHGTAGDLRRWFVGAKSLTLDTVATGERDPATARAALRATLGVRARAVYDVGDESTGDAQSGVDRDVHPTGVGAFLRGG